MRCIAMSLLFFFLAQGVFAQVKTNSNIIDSLASNILLSIYKKNGCKPELSLEMIEAPSFAAYWKAKTDEISLKFSFDKECESKVKYYAFDQEINYLPFGKNSQRFIRSIKLTIAGTDTLGVRKVYSDDYEDILPLSDIGNIENKELLYTKGRNKLSGDFVQQITSQQERTLWQKVAEPTILGIISGAIVYLFFSVRSK